MAIDISNLTPQQLDELIARASEAKRNLHKQRISDVRKKLIQLAKEEGYTIDELFGKGAKGSKGSVSAKYANPADPSQTWTGRGKRPNWFKNALAAGASEASLLVG
ncbi:H-NS family nucleoid-associated regulatory protein [Aquimonas sp.]|jgi:DNA-binding protein H-NS|uniref:H-NS histone family protein n=1 Tax=Aquimonas sp. TaxID=1872588 RepID=UPI0037C192BD